MILLCLILGVFISIYTEEYRLKAGDSIYVSILGQSELSRVYMVLPDGKIYFPLIGELNVSGLSLREVTEVLKTKLSAFLPTTDITVNLIHTPRVVVYIFGEVNKPGQYTFDIGEDVTIVKLLATAGGPTHLANLKKVKIIKSNGETKKVNLKKDDNLLLKLSTGDTIYLSKKFTFPDLGVVSQYSWLAWLWLSIAALLKVLGLI